MNNISSKKLTVTDKIALFLFVLVNLIFALSLLSFRDIFFFLDGAEFYEMVWNCPLGYCFFKVCNRFRPLMFVVNIIPRFFIGKTYLIHYFITFLFVILCEIFVLRLLRKMGCKIYQALLLSCMLLTMSTAGEILSTVCKMDPYLTTCLGLFLLSFWNLLQDNHNRCDWLLLELSIFLAFCTKETWIVIFVTISVMLLWSLLYQKSARHRAFLVFIMFVCNAIVYFLYSHFYVADDSEYVFQYFDFSHVLSFFVFYLKNNPDYYIFGIVTLVATGIFWWRDRKNICFAFCLAVNLTGWAYIVGLCFWRITASYYLYPVGLFFAVSAAVFVYASAANRSILYICIFLLSIFSVYHNALTFCSHRDLSDAYTKACHAVAENTGSGDRVILENSNYYVEQVPHTQYWVNLFGSDCTIVGGAQSIYDLDADEEWLEIWKESISEYQQQKEECMPQEGDYILYLINERDYYSQVRCVNPAYEAASFLESSHEYVWELVDSYMIETDYPALSGGTITKKLMRSGYALYKITGVNCIFSGLFADGWIGKEMIIKNYKDTDDLTITANYTYLEMLGDTDENNLNIYVDDELRDIISLNINEEIQIALNDYIAKSPEKSHTVQITVDRTCVAQESPDYSRELGALIKITDRNGNELLLK